MHAEWGVSHGARPVTSPAVLRLTVDVYQRMLGHCYDGLPLEACGLLGGDPATGKATRCYPTANDAASARVYTVNPKDHLRADRDAEAHGLEIIGVFHSHTHTEAYPSPTDEAQAPDPTWHYVLVSLKDGEPVVRSYRIVDGNTAEEPVVLEPQ
jgi:proteasome lid subunit RPN8/RPN11